MKQIKQVKVYLIGAGPGDAGLFTIKGSLALKEADVVVYDFLVNPKILNFAKETAKMIYVGKSGSSHTLEQDKINLLLVKEAKKGQVVARLKGGDPFTFGRGGEEALALIKNKIPFEIIPGVTSAIAGPAYAGIPITHRGLSSAFTVITGHKRGNKEVLPDLDFKKLADINTTLVVLMGLSNLEKLIQKLTQNNLPANTPAAVISWATYNRQKTIIGNLSNIVKKVKSAKFSPPTIIVIGKVVNLKKDLEWFEKRPLYGKKIVVTRTRKQASVLSEKLESLGADTIEFPTIEIKELANTDKTKIIFNNFSKFEYIIFTSQNAVEIFGKKLASYNKDARALTNSKICAIGSETASALKKLDIIADIVPKEFIAEGILNELPKDLSSKNILLMRAKEARDILPDTLSKRGANVTILPLYETIKPRPSKRIDLSGVDIVTFTSSSCARNFFEIMQVEEGKKVHLSQIKFASIGPITSKTIKDYGHKVWTEAKVHTIDGLVESILKMANS